MTLPLNRKMNDSYTYKQECEHPHFSNKKSNKIGQNEAFPLLKVYGLLFPSYQFQP